MYRDNIYKHMYDHDSFRGDYCIDMQTNMSVYHCCFQKYFF